MVEDNGKTTDNGSHDSGIRAGKQVTLARDCQSEEDILELGLRIAVLRDWHHHHAERSIDYRLRYRRKSGAVEVVFLTALPARWRC